MDSTTLKYLLAKPRILHDGQDVLRQPAAAVPRELIRSAEFGRLIATMVEQMRAAPGVGLAAPQIGVGLRVVVLEDRAEYIARLSPEAVERTQRRALPLTVLINPQLRTVGEGRVAFREGCLSVPGYSAEVERDLRCVVEGLDADGGKVRLQLEGWPARIIQHEVDHIDGILYTDRMRTDTWQANVPVEVEE